MSNILYKAYSPSQWSPTKTADQVIADFEGSVQTALENAKKRIVSLQNVDYGPQKLDIWGANLVDSANHMFVYFHGGYWQQGSKTDVAPIIDLVVNGVGIPCISVGYDLGTVKPLTEIIQQAKTAVVYLQNRFKNAQFTLSGHSAGAYLAAAVVTNLENAKRIKQIILISGIFDLEEFAETEYAKNINLSVEDAKTLSIDPAKLAVGLNRRRVTLFVGEYDSPKFIDQTERLQAAVIEASGNAVECEKLFIRDDDHFSIITNMVDRACDPARHLLRRLRFF